MYRFHLKIYIVLLGLSTTRPLFEEVMGGERKKAGDLYERRKLW